MNNRAFFLPLILSFALHSNYVRCEESESNNSVHELLGKDLNQKKSKKSNKKRSKKNKTLSFNFDSVDLIDIINLIAAEKGVNIILPMGANAINSKVTLHMENPVTVESAWDLLYTLLDIAGYSMEKRHDTYVIVKIGPNINREPSTIYIGVDPAKLPDHEKRIIYLYYLSYLKVPRPGDTAKNELDGILKEMLPVSALINYDGTTNAVIIHDNANNIRSAMMVVKELDKPGFQESFTIIHLEYTQSDVVADLLTKSIIGTIDPKQRLNIRKPTETTYFPQGTRVISEPRTNSLFVLGTPQAIERLREFIDKHIDVELGNGQSILHTYQLQYLDAESFAQVLSNIVSSAGATAQNAQSRAAAGQQGGTERFFEDVMISIDKPKKASATAEPDEYYGGNKLVIACRNDDWERIRKLIEQLDSPQPQVIIEVLIADLTLDDDRILGSMMRNPRAIPLAQLGYGGRPMEFQSDQLVPSQVATNLSTLAIPPITSSIDADLGKYNGVNSSGSTVPINIPAGLQPGSTVMTIADNDGSVWSILQVLKNYGQTKILSHPHIIATNNKKCTVTIGEKRLVAAEATGSTGGAVAAKMTYIDADLKVYLTPRISSAKTVNLSVDIDINEFTTTVFSDANRITRKIKTNANVQSQDILALGGLIKVTTNITKNEVPLLARIPILGWFFKQQENHNVKNNLTVFIRPTIVEPRLRGGIGEYTQDYIRVATSYVREGMLFDTMNEPITRWFFRSTDDANEAVDWFLQQHQEPEKGFDRVNVPEQPSKKLAKNSRGKTKSTPAPTQASQPIDSERAQQVKEMLGNAENPLIANQQAAGQPVLNS